MENNTNHINYLTMDINKFEELPFTYEGSLTGQADPMPFFFEAFSGFINAEDGVLIILPKSDMRTAMAHVLEKLEARVSVCSPDDSYNYMLNLIHAHEQIESDDSSIAANSQTPESNTAAVTNKAITTLIGTVDSLRGLFKHSADISVSQVRKVLISDSYIPASFVKDLTEDWNCEVCEHYTHPQFGGLGAISCLSGDGYHVCRDLYIEIIDPETGLTLPDGKWGEIVVTSLFPAKNPLIRYRTGDVSRYLKSDCDCGSDTPRIDRIRRRSAMD